MIESRFAVSQGRDGWEDGAKITKEQEETFRGQEWVHYLDCGFHRYIHMSKLTTLYTLKMCSLLCITFISCVSVCFCVWVTHEAVSQLSYIYGIYTHKCHIHTSHFCTYIPMWHTYMTYSMWYICHIYMATMPQLYDCNRKIIVRSVISGNTPCHHLWRS